jgi:hypothetical protein
MNGWQSFLKLGSGNPMSRRGTITNDFSSSPFSFDFQDEGKDALSGIQP